MLNRILKASILLHLLISSWTLTASESASVSFCEVDPSFSVCTEKKVECSFCHSETPKLNPYGADLMTALSKLSGYSAAEMQRFLPSAVISIQELDSDKDGASNGEEISLGRAPGTADVNEDQSEAFIYDAATALRRLSVLYCGRHPSFVEMNGLDGATDKRGYLHEQLGKCLESTYWLNEGLNRIADDKIRPDAQFGIDSNVVFADWDFDYRLFSHIMSKDRDVRELLTAQYHIDVNGNVVQGPIASTLVAAPARQVLGGNGQPLVATRRQGMITTQWFMMTNNMLDPLPRSTGAEVYRAWLGLDIAKSQGLKPVAAEPRDVDAKGIKAPDCSFCHSTLDPLSYPFSAYSFQGNYVGPKAWGEAGSILGQPVANLRAWVNVAIASDEFKISFGKTLWNHAFSREPSGYQSQEFADLWKSMPEDGYSANKLIHRLIDTKSFGGVPK